jgi:hypothetical protein
MDQCLKITDNPQETTATTVGGGDDRRDGDHEQAPPLARERRPSAPSRTPDPAGRLSPACIPGPRKSLSGTAAVIAIPVATSSSWAWPVPPHRPPSRPTILFGVVAAGGAAAKPVSLLPKSSGKRGSKARLPGVHPGQGETDGGSFAPGRRKLQHAAALMHIVQSPLAGGREWARSEQIIRDALWVVDVTGGS